MPQKPAPASWSSWNTADRCGPADCSSGCSKRRFGAGGSRYASWSAASPGADSAVRTAIEAQVEAEALAQRGRVEDLADRSLRLDPAAPQQHGVGHRRGHVVDVMGDE